MSKHFAISRTTIAVHDTAPRGVTVVASQHPTCLHLYLHNGWLSRGNMKSDSDQRGSDQDPPSS